MLVTANKSSIDLLISKDDSKGESKFERWNGAFEKENHFILGDA